MIYVKDDIFVTMLTSDTELNAAFNVCAIAIGEQSDQLLIVSVYRTSWATSSDNKDLCEVLESTTAGHIRLIIVGDFNLSTYVPIDTCIASCRLNIINPIFRFAIENNLF